MRTLAAFLFLAPLLPADDVELTSGTVVTGKVEDLGDSIRVSRSGSSAVYPKNMVRKITPGKTPEDLYAEKSAVLKAGDLQGHLDLARWCRTEKLAREAAAEYRKVVSSDPDHEEARAFLGYRLHKGTWMTEEEVNADKGLVRHKGRWVTPEERDLDAALDEQKALDKALLREVTVLLEKIHSSDPRKRDDAVAALAKIEDKYKSKAYLAALTTSHKETRRFAIEEIGRMKEQAAAKPLARRALWDEEEPLRALAFKSLEQVAHPDTALFFVPFLGEESVSARIRCVDAMLRFRDPRLVGYLLVALEANAQRIEALDSTDPVTAVARRTLILPDGSTIVVPKVVRLKGESVDKALLEKLKEEKSALAAALRALTGQDHGEDPAAWRAGLAKKKTGKE